MDCFKDGMSEKKCSHFNRKSFLKLALLMNNMVFLSAQVVGTMMLSPFLWNQRGMVLGRKEGRKQIRRSKGGGAKRGIGKDSMIASKKHESFFFSIFNQLKLVFLQTLVSICSSVRQSTSLSASLSISRLSCELV